MSSQTKFVRRCVYISLATLGFKMPTKYASKYMITVICSTLLLLTGSIVGYLSQNETQEQLLVLSIIITEIATLAGLSSIFMKKQNLLTILKQMKANQHYDYILQCTNIFAKRKLIWFIAVTFIFPIINTISHLLYSFYLISPSDRNSFLIPYWFSCSDERDEMRNILNIICWSSRSRIQFLLSNVIQSLLILFLTPTWLARMTLHILLIKELLVHVDILHSMIHNLNTILYVKDQTTGLPKKLEDIHQQEEHICDQLVQIIKYQQFIKNLVHGIVDVWTLHNSIFVTSFSAGSILLAFIIIRESNGASNVAFKAVCLAVLSSFGFIFICIFGHILSTINENIFDAWCAVPWYLQSIRIRKIYAIALVQNITPVHMKVFRIYELNLPTMFKFLKIAYSTLNVLLLIPK